MSDPVLPVYTKLVADTAGIEALQRRLEDVAGNTKRAFDKNFSDINRIVDTALSSKRQNGGGLDLGTDAIRENVTALRMRAVAAQEVVNALRQNVTAERTLIAAADAAAVEARQLVQAETERLRVLELTQAELAKTKSATGDYVAAIGRGTTANQIAMNSVRASRQAYLQLGQQLQDVAIQAQLGTNPLIILTQQGSQAAFALSGLGGRVGAVARLLAGPWGAAIFGAVTAIGLLGGALGKAGDKADEAAEKIGFLGPISIQASSDIRTAFEALGDVFQPMVQGAINAFNTIMELAQETGISARAFISRTLGDIDDLTRILLPEGTQVIKPTNLQGTYDAAYQKRKQDEQRRRAGQIADQYVRGSNWNFANNPDMMRRFGFSEDAVRGFQGTRYNKPDTPKKLKKGSNAAVNKAARLQEFGEDAADKIARITDQFNDTPSAIARSDQALRQLNDLLDDIRTKNPLNAAELIKAVEAAKLAIKEGYVQPFNDYMKSAREAEAIDALLAKGRDDEAAALSDILRLQEAMRPLSEQQKNDVLATVIAERQRAAVIRDTQAVMNEYAQSIQNVRAALEDTVSNALRGRLSLKGLVNSIGNSYLNLVSKSFVEKMFGGALRSLEDQVNGSDVVKKSSEELSASFYTASDAVLNFARNASNITDYIAGIPNPAAKGLKDPGSLVFADGTPRFPGGGDLVVTAPSEKANVARAMMTPEKFVTGAIEKLFGALNIRLPKVFGDSLGKAMQGAAYGQIGGGLVTALGGRSSGVGAGFGGAVGEAVFKKLAPKLFSKLEDFAGPLGSIAGGLIGGALGGLFGKTPKGVATIGGIGGNLKVASITGNSSKMKAAAGSSADSAITTLEGIAEQLGGTLNASRGSVSIGVRKGQYFVDPTGRGAVKEKKGAIAFGEDAAAAVKAATLDLIKDGVIEGLRAGTQRLLQQGKDLEAAVAKAAKFESVFTRLKQYTDPVGAALDAVDKEFTSLKKLFEEAGASAAEYADLEKLYQKERAKAVEEASAQMTSALRGLLDELKTGDNGRSLRDRLSAALEAYNPLASDLSAGKQVDYDKFAEAARTVIDLERQINGSQTGYFNRLDEVTNLTAKALADQQNVISIASGRPSVISSTAAEPTYEPIVGAIGALNQATIAQLIAMNQNLGTLIAQGGGGSNSSYGLSTALKLF